MAAGKVGDGDSELTVQVMYASAMHLPGNDTVVSLAIRRSRALWLLTASNRAEFFICVERILARLGLLMALVSALWLAVLWVRQVLGRRLLDGGGRARKFLPDESVVAGVACHQYPARGVAEMAGGNARCKRTRHHVGLCRDARGESQE